MDGRDIMRICYRFLVGFFLLILLGQTGCRYSGDMTSGEESTGSYQEQTEQVMENKITESEIAEIEARILQGKEALNEEGTLWYIANSRIEEGIQQQIRLYQGDLLLFGSDCDAQGNPALKMAIISLDTGEVKKETSLTDLELSEVQVCGDKIAVMDWADGEVRILDEALQVATEYQTGYEYTPLYMNPDATKVYCFTEDTGVNIIDMESGDTEVLLQDTVQLYTSECVDNCVSLSYVDVDTQMTERGVFNLESGQYQEIPFSGAFSTIECCDGAWLASTFEQESSYYLGDSKQPDQITSLEESEVVSFIDNPSRIMVSNYGESGLFSMAIYEIDGTFLSACDLKEGDMPLFYNPIWLESQQGYLFTSTDASGKDRLMFWDVSQEVSGEDLQFEPVKEQESLIGQAVDASLYDRAREISTKYGVSVHIAELADTEYNEYVTEPILSEEVISAGLTSLEKVLASYPDGFMQQLVYGEQVKIEIHLTGALTKTTIPEGEVSGFTSFAAFVEEVSAKTIMVVDITDANLSADALEQTMYHEIMHIIDHKLAFDANVRKDAIYSEDGWCALNPEGFEYADDFNELPMAIYDAAYDDWFVDLYSRTYSTEDRARIMEYAMAGEDWMFVDSPKKLAKLEYLCRCIRDSFDTTGWPEETVWEATLARCKE